VDIVAKVDVNIVPMAMIKKQVKLSKNRHRPIKYVN
jgi:hypothetical protein